jgi:hypothetical protein
MAETEGQHKLRTVALLGIIAGIVLIPTGIGAPLIGVSVAALALSTEVARSSLSAGRGAVREETRRAAGHVRSTITEAAKPRPGETPEHPRWWGRKVLRGAAGAVRGARGLRRAMHRRQPGDPAAIGQKPAGPLRRIRSAVRAGAARGARRTRQRLGQHRERLRREGWRGVLPIVAAGLALPGLQGFRDRWRHRPGRPAPAHEPIALGPAISPPGRAALPPGRPGHEAEEAGEDPQEPGYTPDIRVPVEGWPEEWDSPWIRRARPGDPVPEVQPPAEDVAPELAPVPTAIGDQQPAAIGGPMPNLPATRGRYAPNVQGGAGNLPASGNGANHSGWMLLMERIETAVQHGTRLYEAAAAELAKVNPGETHYAETLGYLHQAGQMLPHVRAHIRAVDALEGPIKSATDGVGGPKERADSSYHAVS